MNNTQKALFLLVVIACLITLFNSLSLYRVSGNSMSPSLNNGDMVVVLNHGVIKTYFSIIDTKTKTIFKHRDIVVFGMPTVFGEKIVKFNKVFKRVDMSFNKNYRKPRKDHQVEYGLVPQGGDSLVINETYFEKYNHSIVYDRHNINDDYPISKLLSDNNNVYVFRNNFYFLIGDNYKNSMDSRDFGPIPESFIYGKVLFSF